MPRVAEAYMSADTLHLESTIEHISRDIAVKVVDVTPLSLIVELTMPKMTKGEYRYELLSKGEVVSRGLAVVELGNNEYKQYGEKEEYITAE